MREVKSSYQRLKEYFKKMEEEYQKDIKVLLEGSNTPEIEKIENKYRFLKNQKPDILFGEKSSPAARAINKLFQGDFGT